MPSHEFSRVLENDEQFDRALKRVALEFFDRFDEKFVRIAVFACLERPELARSYLSDPDQDIAKAIAPIIDREIQRGKLRDDIKPTVAALQLVSSIWHFALVAPTLTRMTSRESRRSAVKNFVEIWLNGMRRATKK
jgi:hypothetical protein